MKTINYKGKGEHSVNELELIIEQQADELNLLKSGQKKLPIHNVNKLPESDYIRQQAQQMDEKEFDQWWWETVYKDN